MTKRPAYNDRPKPVSCFKCGKSELRKVHYCSRCGYGINMDDFMPNVPEYRKRK